MFLFKGLIIEMDLIPKISAAIIMAVQNVFQTLRMSLKWADGCQNYIKKKPQMRLFNLINRFKIP